MARVNILMNCYNGAHFLADSLGSIFAQTYQDFEVIFIDNCSSDNSAEVAKSYGAKVKYFRTPKFMSLCEARVWAMQFVDCEFFSMLDVDDLILPTKLEDQVKAFDQNPHVGIIYGNSVHFKDDGEEFLLYTETMPSGKIFRKMLANYFLSLETLMVRKSVMDLHNISISPGYNVSSDAEFHTKLSYFTDALYIDKPLAKWRMSETSESTKQYASFPREYELMIEDLKKMIPNFEMEYAAELKNLRGIIHNMHGLSSWKAGNTRMARERFWKAKNVKKSYLIPWLASFVLNFENYMKVRRLVRRY